MSRSLLCMGALLASASLSTAKPPNVIVVVTDDQGYGDMSCHGNPYIKTPAMDQLHDDSVRLTDFHVDPTCAPTRSALMTGRYSAHTGVWLTYASRHHLRRNEVTMADVFKQNGYKTAMFGKWHLGDHYPFRPMDRGFDESLVHGGGVVGETPDFWDNNYYDDTYIRNGQPEKVTGYCTDVWFNEAKKFVAQNQTHPFFLYLATNAPHGPLHVPEKYIAPFKGMKIKGNLAAFYGCLLSIDENLGAFQDYLNELSLDRDTILVFFNDNGTGGGVQTKGFGDIDDRDGWEEGGSGYNAGMRGKKASHYEGGHRAACFIRWPAGGLTGGRDVDGVTAHIDLLPTLIELCGLDYQDNPKFDGVSLAELVQGKAALPQRSVVVHDQGRFLHPVEEGLLIKDKELCVMRDRWRLVDDELYDLSKDPSEHVNVAAEFPEVAASMRADYEKWWTLISEHADEYCSFAINPAKEKTLMISSQNLLGDEVAYSQRHVRNGMLLKDSWTTIDVEVPGTYRIELRRWPREANAAIGATVAPYPMDPSTHRGRPQSSMALDVKKARLRVGTFDQTVSVNKERKSVVFTVKLAKGEQRIQTWFTLADGQKTAAYYTYIEPAR